MARLYEFRVSINDFRIDKEIRIIKENTTDGLKS